MVTDLLDWDGAGKLRSIRGVYEALYDAGGARASATRGGVAHTYSFGAGLLRDSTAAGSLVHTPGISQGNSGGELYHHEDQLGSVRQRTPENPLNGPVSAHSNNVPTRSQPWVRWTSVSVAMVRRTTRAKERRDPTDAIIV